MSLNHFIDLNEKKYLKIGCEELQTYSLTILRGSQWPDTLGSAGYVLETDGSGILSWVPQGGSGSGDVTFAGPPPQVNEVCIFNSNDGKTIQSSSQGVNLFSNDVDHKNHDVKNVNNLDCNSLVVGSLSYPSSSASNGYVVTQSAPGVLSLQPPAVVSGVILANGTVPMSANFNMGNNSIINLSSGSVSSPSLAFNASSNSGIYLNSPGEPAIASSGVKSLSCKNNLVESFVPFKASGLSYPISDGSAGQVLITNGAGLLSFSSIPSVLNTYGTTGYNNGGIFYTTPINTTPAIASLSRNMNSVSNNINFNSNGLLPSSNVTAFITCNICFTTDTPGTAYGCGIAINGVLGFINYINVLSQLSEMTVSEVRSVNSGQQVAIYLFTTAGNTNISVYSWSISIKNVS